MTYPLKIETVPDWKSLPIEGNEKQEFGSVVERNDSVLGRKEESSWKGKSAELFKNNPLSDYYYYYYYFDKNPLSNFSF